MSKQTAKKIAGDVIAAAAASATAAHTPAAPEHGAIVKHGKHVFVHVGSNYYNVFAASDKEHKNCLASGVTLEKAKEYADKSTGTQADPEATKTQVKEEIKTSPAPANKPAFDGIPSPEAQAKKAEAAGVIKRTNAYFVDPKSVGRVKGWNNRFDFGEIEQLAKSLEANGMLNPIRIQRRPKPASLTKAENGVMVIDENTIGGPIVFDLVDGERRLTAIEFLVEKGRYAKAFPEGIPAIIVDKAQDSMTSLIQMFEANSGKALLPLEEAAAYDRMRKGFPEEGIKGLTIKQICERVGRKQVHVVEMLNLLNADEEVKDAVATGKIGKTMAKQIATAAKGDKEKQKQLTAAAKAAGKSKTAQRAVKKQVDAAKRAKAAAKGKTLKIRALDDAELSSLGAKVAAMMADRMAAASLPLDSDLRDWIKGNPDLALAATFGALEALKAAAGMDVKLEF